MKRIRTAVIGVGHLGRFHAQKYALLPEAELVGVADASPERAAAVAAETGSKAFTSYRDLFGLKGLSPLVDAVSIATPTDSHFPIGLEFLSRGIDVLIEKPVTNTAKEARLLIEEADKHKAILQVGHIERFNPAITALEGRLKDPVYIECARESAFPNRSADVDVTLDLMIHDIDVVLSLVKSEIAEVQATGVAVLTDKADVASARLCFKNGCVAVFTASRAAKERVRKITIYQKDGYFSADYANQLLAFSKVTRPAGASFGELVREEISVEKKDTLLEEIRSFVKCSAQRSVPIVSGADALRALEVAGRIQEAMAFHHGPRRL